MPIDFTVAIRVYNAEKRIPALLNALRTQINTEPISWEIVVVDNNSIDKTAEIIQEYQETWIKDCPLRYYFEPKQGAVFARRRTVQEAQGTFIGFLDDDNIPASNWVATAYQFGQAYPQAGAFGSQIYGDLETTPPDYFDRIKPFLAIIERGSKSKLYDPEKLVLPPGAGLVIRQQAWVENVPDELVLQGPVAGALSAKGEDSEALLYISKGGWEIWYNPEMCVYHKIHKSRLERNYLLSLARGCGLATCHLRLINASPLQKPLIILRNFIGSGRRIVRHLIKYRGQVKSDIVVACEIEFYKSSMMSSFYYTQKWANQLLIKVRQKLLPRHKNDLLHLTR